MVEVKACRMILAALDASELLLQPSKPVSIPLPERDSCERYGSQVSGPVGPIPILVVALLARAAERVPLAARLVAQRERFVVLGLSALSAGDHGSNCTPG
jgi:hypothetical protein